MNQRAQVLAFVAGFAAFHALFHAYFAVMRRADIPTTILGVRIGPGIHAASALLNAGVAVGLAMRAQRDGRLLVR